MAPPPRFTVLFVCTGNICRSPMAEGILKDLLPMEILSRTCVMSAGIGAPPGLPPSENAVLVCADEGIDIASIRSRQLTPALLTEADLVLAMEEHHRVAATRMNSALGERIHVLSRYAEGNNEAPPLGVPDPIGGETDEYRAAYGLIQTYLRRALPRIEREVLARTVGS